MMNLLLPLAAPPPHRPVLPGASSWAKVDGVHSKQPANNKQIVSEREQMECSAGIEGTVKMGEEVCRTLRLCRAGRADEV